MIKFFKKLGYTSLETGKNSKYLKYAIGEIILVVLGILIALSINNWNENRKSRNEEAKILIALKADFKVSKERIEKTIKYQSKVINHS